MLLSAGACCRHAGDAAAAPVVRATAVPGGIEMSEIEAQGTASHAQVDHTGVKAVWIFFDNRESSLLAAWLSNGKTQGVGG